eukprot:1143511-Pelagomonas_calceolata.AAC.1
MLCQPNRQLQGQECLPARMLMLLVQKMTSMTMNNCDEMKHMKRAMSRSVVGPGWFTTLSGTCACIKQHLDQSCSHG